MEISGCLVCFILQSNLKILRHLQLDHGTCWTNHVLKYSPWIYVSNSMLGFFMDFQRNFARVSAVLKRKNICSITQLGKKHILPALAGGGSSSTCPAKFVFLHSWSPVPKSRSFKWPSGVKIILSNWRAGGVGGVDKFLCTGKGGMFFSRW